MSSHRSLWLLASLLASSACIDYERSKQQEATIRESRAGKAVERMKQKENRSSDRAKSVLGQINRSVGERLEAEQVPFVEIQGYVVRGTDESSFRRCGGSRVYYTRMSPPAAAQIAQRYRFRAPSLLYPVYFVVMGRVVDDSVTVGTNHYDAVIEISEVLAERSEQPPECAPPRAGSLVAAR